jgi:pimeloyl-ACP methyl ester carboxylesterase
VDLVFIPTWVTNLEAMWEDPSLAQKLRRLARFSRLICFDKRGSGGSAPVPLSALPTLEQWMDDVRMVMEAVGSVRAVLLGHGEGGQMALLFATYPDRASRRWATAFSRSSMGRPARSGVRGRSVRRSAAWGSRSGRGYTRARSNSQTTVSGALPCISAHV